MKVNSWITGIHLNSYITDKPDSTLMGFDADFGEMIAIRGRLVPMYGAKVSWKSSDIIYTGIIKEVISSTTIPICKVMVLSYVGGKRYKNGKRQSGKNWTAVVSLDSVKFL